MKMINEYSFGHFIKTRRIELNLTQEQLGEQLGVTAAAISKYENEKGYPDIVMMKTLSDALLVYPGLLTELVYYQSKGEELTENEYESMLARANEYGR